MQVKLINIANDGKEVSTLDGMEGPCLSVAISPDSKYIVASSGDKKLRIWKTETLKVVKEIDCFPKVNSFANAKVLCKFLL